MFRRDLLRAVLASPLAGWLGIRAPRAVAGDGANAAAIYRRAFAWAEGVSPEDAGLLREAAKGGPAGPRVDNLVREARPAIEAIREASAVERCDWEAPTLSNDDLMKGHLNHTNVYLYAVVGLSARRHAKAGRGREAVDELFAGLRFAHRIGTGGVLIARVFECGGEAWEFAALGRILPRLDSGALDDISRRLDRLPPPEPASATVGPESRYILNVIRDALKKAGPTIDDTFWAELGSDAEQVAAYRRRFGGDRAAILAHLDTYGPAFAELARRLDLPRPGCRASLEEFGQSEWLDHPFAAFPSLIENTWGVRVAVDRMLAFRAMTRAGVALVRDGEPAFRAVRDPFGDGPFALDRQGPGWVIRSALRDEGKPVVTLDIGDVN